MPPRTVGGKKVAETPVPVQTTCLRPLSANDMAILSTVRELQELVNTESKWRGRVAEYGVNEAALSTKEAKLQYLLQMCQRRIQALRADLELLGEKHANLLTIDLAQYSFWHEAATCRNGELNPSASLMGFGGSGIGGANASALLNGSVVGAASGTRSETPTGGSRSAGASPAATVGPGGNAFPPGKYIPFPSWPFAVPQLAPSGAKGRPSAPGTGATGSGAASVAAGGGAKQSKEAVAAAAAEAAQIQEELRSLPQSIKDRRAKQAAALMHVLRAYFELPRLQRERMPLRPATAPELQAEIAEAVRLCAPSADFLRDRLQAATAVDKLVQQYQTALNAAAGGGGASPSRGGPNSGSRSGLRSGGAVGGELNGSGRRASSAHGLQRRSLNGSTTTGGGALLDVTTPRAGQQIAPNGAIMPPGFVNPLASVSTLVGPSAQSNVAHLTASASGVSGPNADVAPHYLWLVQLAPVDEFALSTELRPHDCYTLPLPKVLDPRLFRDVFVMRSRRLRLEAAMQHLNEELAPLQARKRVFSELKNLGQYGLVAVKPRIDVTTATELQLQRARLEEDDVFARKMAAAAAAANMNAASPENSPDGVAARGRRSTTG